jgi:hypothetical protein
MHANEKDEMKRSNEETKYNDKLGFLDPFLVRTQPKRQGPW